MDGDNANNMPAHTAEWKTCGKIEGTFLSHNSQPSNIGKLQRSNILIFARDPKTQNSINVRTITWNCIRFENFMK